MQKQMMFRMFWFLFSITACSTSSDSKNNQRSQSQYPYAILGDGFGVLNEDDLAINSCEAAPTPFSENSTSYPYWQCFETTQSQLFCDGDGYDESEKQRLTLLVVSGTRQGEYHEYLSRRAIPLDDCKEYIQDWQRLARDEKYICVSGPYHRREKTETGQWISHWTFDKFKTKKGCEPYFFGGCSLQYQLKHGCSG